METVVNFKTTAKSINFLNNEGKVVFKLRVGDFYYIKDNKMYVAKREDQDYYGDRKIFLDEEPACILDEEFDYADFIFEIECGKNKFKRYGYPAFCFTSNTRGYSDTCTKLCK